MVRENKKRTARMVLLALCILQLLLSLYWCSKKNYLFFDEVFSYAAANNTESIGMEFGENTWMDESWFNRYTGVAKEHRFDYSIPYHNQVTDVHPPLFYIFLHTACSFVPEQFSFMAGMSFNILFFLGCTLGIYVLGKELFQSRKCGLLAGFLYGISFGGLNTMVFIRMYMLMAFLAVLHLIVYLKYMEKDQIPGKAYLFLIGTLVAGVLSQYYFLFIAFFPGVWYTIKFLREKRYKVLAKYLMSIACSAGICLLAWPAMLNHLFGGVRGKEAQANLFEFDSYLSNLKTMFGVLSNDMFTKMLPIILLGLLGIGVLCWKKKLILWNRERMSKLTMVLCVCAGYFFMVTKVAPYQLDRYLMPIYPLVYLLIVGISYRLLEKLVKSDLAMTVCILGFGGLSMIHMIHSGIPYTYVKNQNNIERHEIMKEYQDHYVLYISDNSECHHFTTAQILKDYKAFYHVYDLTTTEQTKKDLERIQSEEEILVYITNTWDMKQVNLFLNDVFDGVTLSEENLLDEDDEWNVYLLKR